jgi:DNA-directed RNA polymerase subunit RPC12/RpoP
MVVKYFTESSNFLCKLRSMNLVTIRAYDDAISAYIAKTRLEGEGIDCYVHDENIVTLNPLYNFAVGGVKLRVDEPDKERALEILKEIDATPHTDNTDKIIACPSCGSTELYADFKSMKDAKGILAAITSFLLAVFPIYYRSVYRCKKCGIEFKP